MNEEQLDDLMRKARGHEPFDTEGTGHGLETRFLARLRSGEGNGDLAAAMFWEDLRRWVWASTAGLTPVVVLLVVWLCVWSGFSFEVFAYDAVSHLESYLPVHVF